MVVTKKNSAQSIWSANQPAEADKTVRAPPMTEVKSAYCVAHNTNTLMNEDSGEEEGWGFSAQEVAKLLDPDYAPNDPAEKAAIEYAKAASFNHSNVPRSVLESLAGHMTPPR